MDPMDAEPGPDETEEAWVTVYNAANVDEANIIVEALRTADIPARLSNAALSTLFGTVALGGVDVQVPAEREAEAQGLLASGEEGADPGT